ncbi:MAG TPA: hypothetical protein VG737_08260 [Cyclobacteriaceae bacterium]|nr:hypothetical protein [Cyclobacteriaceae bacterium]
MKSKITFLLAIVVLASCSAPKYAYYFDHHDYNAGKKQHQTQAQVSAPSEVSPLAVDPQELVASTSDAPVVTPGAATEPVAVKKVTYMQMTKAEKKAFRKELGKQIKTYVAAKKKMNSVEAQKAGSMDHDLKLAIIFGAVGIVGLIIGGDVFWIIGGIAMLIGVVFFVKWIIRQ